MKLYDREGHLTDVGCGFDPCPPDNEVLDIISDICFCADVVLYDDAQLYITYRKDIPDDFGKRQDTTCGAVILFDQLSGNPAGFGTFFSLSGNYKSGKYRVAFGKNSHLPDRALKHFPEIDELSDIFTEDDESYVNVMRNILILDREQDKIDKNMRWFIYSKIKSECMNAHFKNDLIYFKLRGTGDEGIVRICSDGRLECMGNFYKTVETFLAAFRRGISVDVSLYGDDNRFIKYAYSLERNSYENA